MSLKMEIGLKVQATSDEVAFEDPDTDIKIGPSSVYFKSSIINPNECESIWHVHLQNV